MNESKLLYKTECELCEDLKWNAKHKGVYDDNHTFCYRCKTVTTLDPQNITKNHIVCDRNTLEGTEFIGDYQEIPSRGLSKLTCEFLGISTGTLYGKKAYGFEYDKGYKAYLYEETPKRFSWAEGSEKDSGPFALDKMNDFSRAIIITEGEIDTASCVELGFQACSLKSGNGSYKSSIQGTHREKILKFKEIWLAFDNDEAGKVPLEQALADLPLEKVKVIDFGHNKDANQALLEIEGNHGYNGLRITLESHVKEWRPEGIIFGNEVNWDSVWEERPEGLKLPWPEIQRMIKGIHKGRLYLFGGGASIGKSSVLRELSYFLRIEYPDLKVAHLFLEEDTEAGPLTYLALHKNIPLGELLENKELIPKSERQDLQKILTKNTMFTNEQYELGSEELLLQLGWLVKVKKYDIIILDHISMVAEASNSKESERICINQLMHKLKSLTRRTGLTVIAACHLSNPDQGKDWEEGREVKQKDFHGSSALRKVPDVMIGVERNMRDKYNCDQLVLRVIKNRWFSKTGIADTLTYITSTGRLK